MILRKPRSRVRGFWSYVRADDRADRGRIRELADDVATQYEMLTCEQIELFFDQHSLTWGDDWQQKIDERLESAAFFIPVVTPRYLTSEACRRELWTVAQRAEAVGLKGLILPLYYVDVPSLATAHQVTTYLTWCSDSNTWIGGSDDSKKFIQRNIVAAYGTSFVVWLLRTRRLTLRSTPPQPQEGGSLTRPSMALRR